MSGSSRWLIAASCLLCVAGMTARAVEGDRPWKVSLGVEERFNDNRDGTKSSKESNLDSIVEPRVDALYDLQRAVIDLYYAPYALWRTNPRDDQNSSDLYQSVGGDLTYRPSDITRIFLQEQFDYTDDPRVSLDSANAVRENASYTLNRLNGAFERKLSDRTSFDVNGQYSIKRYQKKAFSDTCDEDLWGGNANLKWLSGKRSSIFGTAGFSDGRFTGIRQGTAIMMGGLGSDCTFSPNLYGRIVAGYQKADPKDADVSSADSGTAQGELVVSASPASRLRLNGTYGLQQSDYDPFSYQAQTRFSARVERDMTARIGMALTALYANGHYSRKAAVDEFSGGITGGDDTLYDGQFSVAYKINRIFTASLYYEYEDWNSDIRESFKRNTVSGALRAEF